LLAVGKVDVAVIADDERHAFLHVGDVDSLHPPTADTVLPGNASWRQNRISDAGPRTARRRPQSSGSPYPCRRDARSRHAPPRLPCPAWRRPRPPPPMATRQRGSNDARDVRSPWKCPATCRAPDGTVGQCDGTVAVHRITK
jgi:hypothetical protein